MYVPGPTRTFIAGEDLAAHRRVKLSASTVVYADAGEAFVGITEYAVASGEEVAVKLPNSEGTFEIEAAGTFANGAQLYGAADGKADDVAIGQILGTALEAATAGGDIVEFVMHIGIQAVNYDITYGPVLAGGAEQGTFEVDTTQNYALGTKRETPDGEIYRYAKAGTYGVKSCFGAAFMKRCYSSGAESLNEVLHVQAEIGDTTITMEQASVVANAFAGGYCTIGGGAAGTERHRIVSNTASAASTNHVTLTLDTTIRKQWTTSAWVECMVNPWSDTECIVDHGNEYATFAGIPAVDAVDGEYYWCQTKGIVFIVPGGGDAPGDTAREREVFFVGDGSVNGLITAGHTTGLQKAGVIVQLDASGQGGPPYVLLQIE